MLILVACVAGGAVFVLLDKSHNEVGALSPSMKRNLDAVVIPHVDLKEATLDEAVAYLNEMVQRSGAPTLRIERWRGEKLPGSFHLEGDPEKAERQAHERSSLTLSNCPSSEVLRYVGALFTCTLGQHGNTLYLIQGNGFFGPDMEKTFDLSEWKRGRSVTADDVRDELWYNLIPSEWGTIKISGDTVTVRTSRFASLGFNSTLIAKPSFSERLVTLWWQWRDRFPPSGAPEGY